MIDPVAFSLFGIKVYWYGLTYAIGFLFSYFFIIHYASSFRIKKDQIEHMFPYVMIFSVLGGRLAYILFYNPLHYLADPLDIIAVWNGGMSIHGGILGAILTLYYFSKKYKIRFLRLTDLFSLPTGLALAFGRLANFVNQELVGTPTDSSIGITFPAHDDVRRWPTTIFESIKNMMLFQFMLYLHFFIRLKTGFLTAIFLIFYSFPRFFIDFLREPTVDLGIMSMGQLLSLITGFLGLWLLYKIKNEKKIENTKEKIEIAD